MNFLLKSDEVIPRVDYRHIKGFVHLALALASTAEAIGCKSKIRMFLCGLAAGYHTNATFYHFCLEKLDDEDQKRKQ